jgi:cyclopropane fatty-acyl-phospholipid synthase-like methyltransferase
MPAPRTFTNEEIRNYYDHTEVHYRRFWKLEKSMGLHYGVWDKRTSSLSQSIENTNVRLAQLGDLRSGMHVLDAGCGVGGSAIFLAKKYGCRVTGITLSDRQVGTATRLAEQNGVSKLVRFERMDYTATSFPPESFDLVWAIESMQTAPYKDLFFVEMSRILKPGGKLLVADVFKNGHWRIEDTPLMQTMLHGWAMSDILTLSGLGELAEKHTFVLRKDADVTGEIAPSVRRIFWASLAGMVGTKAYNLVHRATYFSKIHYKTGIAQYFAWKKKLWKYHLICIEKT